MTRERIANRLRAMRYSYEGSKYLTDTAPQVVCISDDAGASARESAIADHQLMCAHVAHLLNSIVFEISVKILWEIDNGSEPRHTHNVGKLFKGLSDDTKRYLTNLYEDTRTQMDQYPRDGGSGVLGDLVSFQSLDEALVANEDTIKNFKYNGAVRGKSTLMGRLVWNLDIDTRWILPPVPIPRFVDGLHEYVNGRAAHDM